MSIHVTVNGVNRDAWVHSVQDDLKWTSSIGQRGNATIVFTVPKADFDPSIGQSVLITDGTAHTFGGILDTKTKLRSGYNGYFITCTFVSWESRLDSRLITPRTYKNQTCAYIITDILTGLLAAEGFTIANVQPGNTIEKVVYDYDTVSDAFDQLAKDSGYIWYMDADKGFYFVPQDGSSAFTLTGSDILFITGTNGSPMIEDLRQDFRDRQLVRMAFAGVAWYGDLFQGDGATTSWALSYLPNTVISAQLASGAQASVSGTFTSPPSNNDYISIPNSTTAHYTRYYVWVTALDNTAAFGVLIGPDAASCAQNFADAVNGNPATAGTAYSSASTPSSVVKIVNNGGGSITCLSIYPGLWENGQLVGTGVANGDGSITPGSIPGFSWDGSALSGGTGTGTTGGTALQLAQYDVTPSDASGSGDILWSHGDTSIYQPIGATPYDSSTFIWVEYYRLGSDVVTVQDDSVISARATVEGGSGITEDLIDDSQNASVANVLAEANANLNAYKTIPQLITVQTRKAGIFPGMIGTLAVDNPPVSGTFVVQQVDASYHSPSDSLWYTVYLQGGTVQQWIQFWEQLAGLPSGNIAAVVSPTAGTGATPAAAQVPDVVGLTCGVITREDGARSGARAVLVIACNAPDPLGAGDYKFLGYEIYLDDGERRISLGRSTPFTGPAGFSVGQLFFAQWPDADATWTIYAVSYSAKYENEINSTTPSVIKLVIVSTGPPSGAIIPVVTNLSFGAVMKTSPLVAGRPVGEYASIPLSYNAPEPLGTGDTTFTGVEYFLDTGTETVSIGKGTYAFTGSGGAVHADTVISQPVPWPTTEQSWDVYAVSQSNGYSNALVKKGSIANVTPYVTIDIGAPLAAPNVPNFKAGISNSDGSWTLSMRWDPTQTELLIDWAATMPVTLDSASGNYVPAPNFGGVNIAILAGGQLFMICYPSIIGSEQFAQETSDPATFVHRDTISILPDQVPESPTEWTFVCQSYSTDAYPVGNHENNGLPAGPTVVLETLEPVVPLTLQPAAAVTVGTIVPSYIWPPGANVATQNPSALQLNIPYTTPTGWIGLGVHVYVEYPDGSATAVFTLDSSHLDSTDGIGSSTGIDDEGQFPATDRPDINGAHHVIISNLAVPTASTNIRVYCQAYTRDVDPVLVLANQTGATPSAVVTVTPPAVFAQGQEYAANVTDFTATSYYQNDGNGHPQLWIQSSWTPPNDPNFAGVKLALFRYNSWMPQGPYWSDLFTAQQGDWNAATGTYTTGPRRSPVLGDLPRSPETTDVIYAVSFNQDGQYNTITQGVTPSEQIELDAPPMGSAGTEYTLAVVTNIAVTLTITQTPEGIWQFNIAATFTAPSLTAYPEFNGCEVVLRNTTTSTNQSLGFTTPSATSFSKTNISIDTSLPTYDLYFVSCTKLNENTLVPGTTPRYQGLHPVPTSTASINSAYIKQGSTVSTDGSGNLIVANNSLNIAQMVSGIRPVAFTTADPALPSSTYPAGTVECRVDLSPVVYKRVNAAGTGWEALVSTGDIAANSITSPLIQAGAVLATQVGSGTFPVGVVYAGDVIASQVTSGTFSGISLTLSSTTSSTGVTTTTQVDTSQPSWAASAGGIRVIDGNSPPNACFVDQQHFTIYGSNGTNAYAVATMYTLNTPGATGTQTGQLELKDNASLLGTHRLNLTYTNISFDGTQVLTSRQTGPGTPSFSTVSDAQTWCGNLLTALRSHGIVT